jgi:small subunit ribosomal protein S1
MTAEAATEQKTAEKKTEQTAPAAKKKRRSRKKPNDRGRGRGRGPRVDLSPPRFDVADLAALAGPPLWHAVHPAVVKDVTDAAVFVEVTPVGRDPLRAAVERAEFANAPEAGAELKVRLGPEPTVVEAENSPVATASWRQAEELAALDRVLGSLEANEPVVGVVVAEVKGGFSVALGADDADAPGTIRAFLPRSQATLQRGQKSLDVVGLVDDFDVVEVESERANVVVGRRKRLLREQKKKSKETWANLEMDQTVTGTVRALVPYGAFLDVGGVDGLLHVSDLSWDRQPRVADVVSVGQTLETKVIALDRGKKKLKLGLKQLLPDPWADAGDLAPGSDIEGDVVAITDFGAFVRVSDGVEGLVHLSEISWDRVKHPSNKFKIGDRVKARVLESDPGQRRLSLSTKALEANPYERVKEQYPEGTKVTGKVKSLVDFGAFVEIEDGVDGLIHNGEMSWTERVDHASQLLTIGDEVEVVVISVDVPRQRVSCSLKRTKADPFQKWEKTFAKGTRHKVTVTRVSDGGANVELDEGLNGFVKNRDLSTEAGTRAQDVVKTGEEIEVEVMHFDRRTRRVSLSARAVIEGETRAAYDEYKKKEREMRDDRLTLGDALRDQLANLSASPGATKDEPGDDKSSLDEESGAEAELENEKPEQGDLFGDEEK